MYSSARQPILVHPSTQWDFSQCRVSDHFHLSVETVQVKVQNDSLCGRWS